jgi:hypothetical protein
VSTWFGLLSHSWSIVTSSGSHSLRFAHACARHDALRVVAVQLDLRDAEVRDRRKVVLGVRHLDRADLREGQHALLAERVVRELGGVLTRNCPAAQTAIEPVGVAAARLVPHFVHRDALHDRRLAQVAHEGGLLQVGLLHGVGLHLDLPHTSYTCSASRNCEWITQRASCRSRARTGPRTGPCSGRT